MSDIVASGKALYWGTSEWTADEIRAAWEIAERHHLHKPADGAAAVQPLEPHARRVRVRPALRRHRPRPHDMEPARRRGCSPASTSTGFRRTLAGTSPATSGCRACSPTRRPTSACAALKAVADDLGCTLAELSLAWCTKNPHVSTGHHRRESRLAGAREHGRARRRGAARRRGDGPHRRGGAVPPLSPSSQRHGSGRVAPRDPARTTAGAV